MIFNNEQIELIIKAYECLEKVVEDVPLETEGIHAEILWAAFLKLTALRG